MMQPYSCIYVFDSSTANEAAKAVSDGHYNSIIQYHNSKHQHSANKPMQGPPPSLPPPHHMMGGHPSYAPQPPHHHVSPPNHMQQQPQQHPMVPGAPPPPPGPPQQMQQQPYDPSLSPQKMKERESKLNRIGQIAQMTQPAPPTMHQMAPANQIAQRIAQGPIQPPQNQPPPPQPSQQHQTSQQHHAVKQEQPLDPLSSMQAMTEAHDIAAPNSYQHTIHHHP